MKTPDSRQHKMREKIEMSISAFQCARNKIHLLFYFKTWFLLTQFAKMRCQSANLDLKFIFHQLMSSNCNIVRQFITQQWDRQPFIHQNNNYLISNKLKVHQISGDFALLYLVLILLKMVFLLKETKSSVKKSIVS